jgi:hypothetical protein
MPRIPQYTNQQNIDPSILVYAGQAAQRAGQAKAQAIEQSFDSGRQALKVVEQHIERNETGKLSADFATAQAELTAQWNEIAKKADPNDHAVAERFMNDVVTPRLEGMGKDLLTAGAQDMHMKAAAGLKADLFAKSTADQATLAGNAAIVNLDTTMNQLSQTARIDPSSFKSALAMANLTTEGLVQAYGLPRDKALQLGGRVREEIAKSAFFGMADKNPTAALDALNSGQFAEYFDGTTAKSMQSYAEQHQHAEAADARAQEAEQKRQQKETYDDHMAKLQVATINPQTGQPQIPPGYFKQLANVGMMPQAEASSIRAMQEWGRTVLEDQAKGTPVFTDANVYESFAQRMMLPAGDPNALEARDIYAARTAHILNDKDTNFFLEAQKRLAADPGRQEAERQFNFFLSTQKNAFTGSNQFTGFRDPKGDAKYYQFATAARAQFQAAYAQGGDAWKKMLQPGDPNFVGKLAPQYLQNQKNAKPNADLYGTTQGGYRFTGHTAAEWSDKSKWKKIQ